MTADPRSSTRRRLLRASSSLVALALAGCLGDDDGATTTEGEADDSDDFEFDRDVDDEYDHDPGRDDVDVSELLVYDRDGDEQVANSHAGHWHYGTAASGLPSIEVGSEAPFDVTVTKDGAELPLDSDGPYRLGVVVAEAAADDVVSLEVEPAHATVVGEAAGETAITVQLLEDGAVGWETPPIDATVES